MKRKKTFPRMIIQAIDESKILGIRAGTEPHRIIGIWAVVVAGRVFARSWSLTSEGWYRTFLKEPRGVIQIGGREIRVRAIHTRSERIKDAVSSAYFEKYNTPGSIRYARDLGRAKSREATIEFVPL